MLARHENRVYFLHVADLTFVQMSCQRLKVFWHQNGNRGTMDELVSDIAHEFEYSLPFSLCSFIDHLLFRYFYLLFYLSTFTIELEET